MENDDLWHRHGSRTADRGPRSALPAHAQQRTAGMTGRGGPAPDQPSPRESDGWRVFSYMIGGMVLYGAIGWLIGHWTGISILFPLGMILGIVLSILLIAFRFTRS
jgi:F0F1-type ATP synthase assembly protein I